jgi:predicted membrane-bound mannosyltransferase
MTMSHMSFCTSRSLWWRAGFIFLVALAVRLLGASSNPVHVDELYHLLAGRSWAEEGTFRMLDGEYLRSRGFTALVGYTFELFGRSDLYIARLPSVLAGALLASAIFIWLSRQASIQAGWLGALLFCFSSYAIVNTQFTRFYALQALTVWLGAAAIYKLLALPDPRRGWWLMAAASIAFLAAIHLQITTVIAIMALSGRHSPADHDGHRHHGAGALGADRSFVATRSAGHGAKCLE